MGNAYVEIPIRRERTALRRSAMSRPLRLAIGDGLIDQSTTVFDYGCGHGDDLRHLRHQGIECSGWDPVFAAENPKIAADVINLGYVVNVIENSEERAGALAQAWNLTQRVLIVAGRLSLEAEIPSTGNCFADGYLTNRGTFQKLFEQSELRDWIESVLGERPLAAAPGIFYVFKDAAAREAYSVSRFKTSYERPALSRSTALFELHKEQFEALSDFIQRYGRIPLRHELEAASFLEIEFGSMRRAVRILRRAQTPNNWDEARKKRSQDILVYLALSRFPKRCKFTDMPESTRLDIRAFFGTYSRACEQADDLLFSAGRRETIENACSSSKIGKLTQEALYLHETALSELPPVLRVYEGCARVLVGRVEGGNIIKLHRGRPTVSYLSYPAFENVGHPTLSGSLLVDLQKLRVSYRDYANSENRPILHRKEQFVSISYPLYAKFSKLTRQEERKKLFENPGLIGYERYWQDLIEANGLKIAGHRLMRSVSKAPPSAGHN